MRTSPVIRYGSSLIALIVIVIFSSAFSISKSETHGPQDPVKLVYNMAEGNSVSYVSATLMNQAMDVNGQTMNVLVDNNLAFKVKMLGKTDNNLRLEITIDSLATKIESQQGSSGGKISDVRGKTFNMLLSPLGKEIDVSEAAKIEYAFEGSPANNLSQAFASIFPDLPENLIKPGDTWTKSDTIRVMTASAKTTQIIQSTNKFEGLEKIDGMECAKITSTVTGTMESNVQNMGRDIYYRGPLQGTVTLYFAVKEGYFVRQNVSTRMTGTVDITGPQNMTFPVIMETTGKIENVK